jgi:DNA-cytosine methyltransferase
MNVLSLFDGISCGLVALKRNQIPIQNYYACEIDKYAIKVSKHNHPEIQHLGSVVGLVPPKNIDLLIGGSPCQDLSIAKKGRKGLDGERSGLFWEYVRILKECNPKYFILENVNSMSKESKQTITEALGVEPIMIDASLVSAQSRKRLFWTNISVKGLPKDKGILLKDILQDAEVDDRMVSNGKAYTLTASYNGAIVENSIKRKQRTMVIGHIGNTKAQANRVYSTEGKSVSLSANGGGLGAKTGLYDVNGIRKLTPIECERLQGLPDDYTKEVSNTQRYKCLGNAFNVDVICFILGFINNGTQFS